MPQGTAKPVPVVLALHGYSCSGWIYAENSGWCDVANQYGFIVIFPSALRAHVNMPQHNLMPHFAPNPAWNIFGEPDRPDELRFIDFVLERTEQEYEVNKSRIYVTGHSWGSLMTQMLALGRTERFAAVAPCSGVSFGGALEKILQLPDIRNHAQMQIPIWMHWGMNEEWLIAGDPTHDNETGMTVEFWLRRNGKAELIPENWNQLEKIHNGRFKECRFEKEKTAPVWITQIDSFPHGTMPEMSYRIWEMFFSKQQRMRNTSKMFT